MDGYAYNPYGRRGSQGWPGFQEEAVLVNPSPKEEAKAKAERKRRKEEKRRKKEAAAAAAAAAQEATDATPEADEKERKRKQDKRKSKGVSLQGGGMTMSILELLQHIVNEPAPRLTPEGRFPKEAEDFVDSCLLKDPDQRQTPKDLLVCAYTRLCGILDEILTRARCRTILGLCSLEIPPSTLKSVPCAAWRYQ